MCQCVALYCDVLLENECEYLNWTLTGLLSPRASLDWTQGLLTHETPSLYHLLFKISPALEYIFRAAMILYNLVTGCQPWTFIHPLNCYEQFKIIHGGSSGQILAGKTSWRSILNHSLSYFHHYQLGEGCPASSINIWLIQNVADIE